MKLIRKTMRFVIQKIYLIAISLSFCAISYGQADTLSFNGFVDLRGMWQTGNLNQINLMPNGKIWLLNAKHYAEVLGAYQYIKVDGFKAKNDLWLSGLYQHKSNNLFYLSGNLVSGFALSYQINHSLVAGLGGGVNIIKKSSEKYFQFHLHGSYLDFKFAGEEALRSVALSSLLRAKIPVTRRFNFRWELSSYHSMKETIFWGGGNMFQLIFNLSKNFSFNINHQIYYNHQTVGNIENFNAQMLFGFQYLFSK